MVSVSQTVGPNYTFRGFNDMQNWSIENLDDANGFAALDQMKKDHCNWVGFDPQWYQSSPTASDANVTRFQYQVPESSIINAIDYAHKIGLKVMVKPMIESIDGTYRGFFQPTDLPGWFTTLNTFLTHWATISQAHHVELFTVGTEYVSLDVPANHAYWSAAIKAVRQVFTGGVTYAANWTDAGSIPFWAELDYIGIDAYFPFAANGLHPSVSYLVNQWNTMSPVGWMAASANFQSPVQFMLGLAKTYNKRIIFTELGWASSQNAYTDPGDSAGLPGVDTTEQVDDYNAFFKVFGNRTDTYFAGAFFWNWEPSALKNLQTYPWYPTGFTPQFKPAEATISNWFNGPISGR